MAECCSCAFCRSGPHTTWSTPDGVVLESLTTATEPPFVYVFNPLDKDMLYIRERLVVEPDLTRIWMNSTRECCAAPGGLVVDVGSNFGWYAMLSLSLGCSVVAFEPVRAYQDVIRLAVHLNGASFAKRLTVYGNAVLDKPGNFSMIVPLAGGARPPDTATTRWAARVAGGGGKPSLYSHKRTHMGIAALLGPRGRLAVKDVAESTADTLTYRQPVTTVRIDAVRVVQLEVTRKRPQTCANVRMLRNLLLLGFDLYMEHRALSVASLLSERLAPGWRPASGVVPSTLDTVHALAAAEAFKLFQDVVVYSWNLVGYQRAGRGPLGWVLPELPLPHALAASCRAAQRCEDVETLSRQDQLACAMSACMSVRKDRALAGCYIGMGGLLSVTVAGGANQLAIDNPSLRSFLIAILFPINLVIITVTGGLLFTGATFTTPAAWLEGKASLVN
eukprot:jgi/Chrpa1/20266/Chrysochromulina_OHIO_Genome00024436-RA